VALIDCWRSEMPKNGIDIFHTSKIDRILAYWNFKYQNSLVWTKKKFKISLESVIFAFLANLSEFSKNHDPWTVEDMIKLSAPLDISRRRRFQKSGHFLNLSKIYQFRGQKSRDTLTPILGCSGGQTSYKF